MGRVVPNILATSFLCTFMEHSFIIEHDEPCLLLAKRRLERTQVRISFGTATIYSCSRKNDPTISHSLCSLAARSVFLATAGRGLMFCGERWREVVVEDQSSRKLLLAAIAALGSFGSSTPHFWTNVLTVFSCSISLVSLVHGSLKTMLHPSSATFALLVHLGSEHVPSLIGERRHRRSPR